MRSRRDLHFDAAFVAPGERNSFSSAGHQCNRAVAFAFYWSHRRLRHLGVAIAALAVATAPVMLAQNAVLRALCLCWFAMLAVAASELARRIRSHEPVITIDSVGLHDSRALDRPIYWQDVRTLCRCHPTRSRVVELFLTHPHRWIASHKGRSRFGAWMQRAFGVPAVTISLLLIDASAADILSAIATFRPGLIPRGMLSPG